MEKDNLKKYSSGKIVLAFLGFILLISPLNPFIEYEQIGEDSRLTNSSWLVMVVLIILYWLIVLPLITGKKG